MKLTIKQERFVEALMGAAKGNATEAARLAGYKGNASTLTSVGSENLRKPHIRAAIDARQKTDPLVADRDERQQFLTRVMRGEEETTVRSKDGAVEVAPVDISARIKACELLGKAAGDFVTKVDHTTKGDAIGGTVMILPSDGSEPDE